MLSFLKSICASCCVCIHAHTEQYVISEMQSNMSAACSMESSLDTMATTLKIHASWFINNMKPMMPLSHCVFMTRCSSCIKNLFVATADGKHQNTSHAKHNSGLFCSPQRPEMHDPPLQHVYPCNDPYICFFLCCQATQGEQNVAYMQKPGRAHGAFINSTAHKFAYSLRISASRILFLSSGFCPPGPPPP